MVKPSPSELRAGFAMPGAKDRQAACPYGNSTREFGEERRARRFRQSWGGCYWRGGRFPIMKVALYARVSKVGKTVKQDPEVQLRELRAWCETHKHQITLEYVDQGFSGAKASRPQLDRLMRDATKGLQDFEVIVVWRLDRFGRSLQHLQNAVAVLRDAKVGFISLKEGFDLTTPMGKAFFGMLGVFAEFERDVIAERVRAGMQNAKSKGILPGRKIDAKKGPSRTTIWRRKRCTGSGAVYA